METGLSPRRIIIVGGGMAGLSAAYQLSLTSELRKQYHVTVYQLGWRLGGKCASGRDAQGRNIEHGLHIWFGHYLNAFQMLAEVYRDLPRKGAKVDLNTLILPQGYTPIGDPDGAKPTVYDVNFPTSKKVGIPGREPADLSIANCLSHAIGLLINFHDYALGSDSPIVKLDKVSIETIKMRDDPRFPPSRLLGVVTARTCLEIASAWLLHLDEDMISFGLADMELVRRVLQGAAGASCHMTFANTAAGHLFDQALRLAWPLVDGIFDDIVIEQRSIQQMDGEDFRRWLVRHGAEPSLVKQSPMVRALYDTMFQYPDGDIANASYGAGTAVQVLLRALGTYQGAVAWELQAGAGEVIVAPLFEILKQRDVEFRFFHKLTDIRVSSDGRSVDSLHFDVQAIPKSGYEWTVPIGDGLFGWSSQPDWLHLDVPPNGCVDFESFWCNERVGTDVKTRVDDFDDVVLAIPLGAFKKFTGNKSVERPPGPGLSGIEAKHEPFDDLYNYSTGFWNMAAKLRLVPSIAVQLWSTRSLADLGWSGQKPALVSGPNPLDIWADMSQFLRYERRDPPYSLHYLCDVFPSKLYAAPRTSRHAQEMANLLAYLKTLDWLEHKAKFIWPKVMTNGAFDWTVLYDDQDRHGYRRIRAQHVKANISPWDCCVATAAGTSAWRLKTDESGFKHLYLAGTWIDTGFNTECVETAVISGMQAARAITGAELEIPGERFLHATRQFVSLCDVMRRCAPAPAE
ncbi:uncharacterized protein with NAD-binding domain and iron-sulfur cluster [Bradyrhizobium sp. USDA 3315]